MFYGAHLMKKLKTVFMSFLMPPDVGHQILLSYRIRIKEQMLVICFSFNSFINTTSVLSQYMSHEYKRLPFFTFLTHLE